MWRNRRRRPLPRAASENGRKVEQALHFARSGSAKVLVGSAVQQNRCGTALATVDGPLPVRRAISRTGSFSTVINRKISRTRRIEILSAGTGSLLERIKERPLDEPAEASGASSPNAFTHPQRVGGITPEWVGAMSLEPVGGLIPESLGGISPEWWSQSLRNHHSDDVAKVLKGAIAPLSFGEKRGLLRFAFAAVAQLVRAPDCGSGGPPFEPGQRYQQNQGVS